MWSRDGLCTAPLSEGAGLGVIWCMNSQEVDALPRRRGYCAVRANGIQLNDSIRSAGWPGGSPCPPVAFLSGHPTPWDPHQTVFVPFYPTQAHTVKGEYQTCFFNMLDKNDKKCVITIPLWKYFLFLTGYRLLWLFGIRKLLCIWFTGFHPSSEKDTDIALIRAVSGFPKCKKVRSPHTCFATHALQNKEQLSLKQWHLKIGYGDRSPSFNAFKQYILLP